MKRLITEELIGQLCELAQLKLEPSEVETVRGDLAQLVEFVNRLEDVTPERFSLSEGAIRRRQDLSSSQPSDALLSLSSRTEGKFVRVPRVIDSDE